MLWECLRIGFNFPCWFRTSHIEWAGDGWDGIADEHEWDFSSYRRPEQDPKGWSRHISIGGSKPCSLRDEKYQPSPDQRQSARPTQLHPRLQVLTASYRRPYVCGPNEHVRIQARLLSDGWRLHRTERWSQEVKLIGKTISGSFAIITRQMTNEIIRNPCLNL